MNVKFGDKTMNVRSKMVMPTRFKLNDLLVGPNGTLLQVVTVQTGCPIWESNRRTKCVIVLKSALGTLIPTDNLAGHYQVLRPVR